MEHYQTELHDCLFQMPRFFEIIKVGLEKLYQRLISQKKEPKSKPLTTGNHNYPDT